jgi:starvation-inducible outer membrane lipoprotein
MNSTHTLIGAALAAALVLTGCATGPEKVENDFGNSVRHMQQVQSVNPNAPVDGNAIDGGDAERANATFEAMRKDVGKPENVKQGVIINVGGGN